MEKNIKDSGIILVDKPIDWTSNDVVQFIKRKFNFNKIGHAGTLDPKATGLMILGINNATKKLNNLLHLDKKYSLKIKFHYSSDSFDMDTNKIKINYNEKNISINDINNVIEYFINLKQYLQTPPKFSAVKINGVRAYKLARKNIDFTIAAKKVKIFQINNIKFAELKQILSFDIHCSSGFYIRSLVNDISNYLGVTGLLIELRRTCIGKYTIDNSLKVTNLKQNLINNNELIINKNLIDLND